MTPVIYDLDDETGEATGTVHYFCCTGCRSQSPHKLPDASNYGDDHTNQSVGMQCETCGRTIADSTTGDHPVIWSCEAHNRTPEDAAHEFSRSYWQEPRRRRRMDADGRFQMYGEWATYRVVAIPATSPHAALYGIVRE